MLRECFGQPEKSCKVRINRGPSETGPRFGGRPPEGVSPQNAALKYLVTLPWDGKLELSVFVDTDLDFIYGDDVELPCGSPHFEVILHTSSKRGPPGPNDSALSEHPLDIDDLADDVGPIDDDGVVQPFSGHKLGGRPYFVHGDLRLEAAVRALLDAGFRHFLQMDFPAERAAGVSGPWPFGTGIFHVLVREVDAGVDSLCFWEM